MSIDPMKAFLENKKIKKSDTVFLDGKALNSEDTVPTPFMNLNYALSKNPYAGFEFGRITEIFGDEATGKTSFCLEVAAYFQKVRKLPVLYVDSENSLNTRYALELGINKDLFILRQPENGEQAFEEIKAGVEAGFKLIINDSVAGNVPQAIMEGNAEDHHIGVHARLVGKELSVLRSLVAKHKCHIIFINQTRLKIGAMGDPTETTGGKAFKFWAGYRIQLLSSRGKKVEEKKSLASIGQDSETEIEVDFEEEIEIEVDDKKSKKSKKTDKEIKEKKIKGRTEEVGKGVDFKIIKNKNNNPYVKIPMKLYYGKGYSPFYSELNFYKDIGLIEISESMKSLKFDGKGYNSSNFKELIESKEFKEKLKALLPKGLK